MARSIFVQRMSPLILQVGEMIGRDADRVSPQADTSTIHSLAVWKVLRRDLSGNQRSTAVTAENESDSYGVGATEAHQYFVRSLLNASIWFVKLAGCLCGKQG